MKFSSEDIFEAMAEEIGRGSSGPEFRYRKDDADWRELERMDHRARNRKHYKANQENERARRKLRYIVRSGERERAYSKARYHADKDRAREAQRRSTAKRKAREAA